MTPADIGFHLTSEEELAAIMAGQAHSAGGASLPFYHGIRVPSKMTGVFTLDRTDGAPPRPIILVAREEDQRRLFARFSQLRGDLTPLTSWCHLMQPDLVDRMDDVSVYPNLRGMTAAWSGLAISEAALLANRPVERLTDSACFGTQTFVIARALALWGAVSHGELMDRYDSARSILSIRNDTVHYIRDALSPIWSSLIAATVGVKPSGDRTARTISEILIALAIAQKNGSGGTGHIVASGLLGYLSEAPDFKRIEELTAGQRLKLYDRLVANLGEISRASDSARYIATTFACGYLVTVLAGGSASLGVAQAQADQYPEILAWAYVIGSLGETITWTSSFDGLGRLVARELERPLHLAEPPLTDISIEEATALFDPALSDPLVHLRLKSPRSVDIAILPGVAVRVTAADHTTEVRAVAPRRAEKSDDKNDRVGLVASEGGLLEILADALAPLLIDRMRQLPSDKKAISKTRVETKSKVEKERGQVGLPFSTSKKR